MSGPRELLAVAEVIESWIPPKGTEDPAYLRGKQAGLRLAAAEVRRYAADLVEVTVHCGVCGGRALRPEDER